MGALALDCAKSALLVDIESGRVVLGMSQRNPITYDNENPVLLRRRDEARRTLTDQLPVTLTSFVGRDWEVASIRELLNRSDVRLVTLTGTCGVGKTRLALKVAEDSSRDFPDGLAFVPLAGLSDPNQVAQAVAQALGVAELASNDPAMTVQGVLNDRAFLLLLDNFEHLLSAGPLLTQWLSHCRWLTILVTSRARLRISGEHEHAVDPLEVPSLAPMPSANCLMTVPSVRLFLQACARCAHRIFVDRRECSCGRWDLYSARRTAALD